MSRDYDDDRDDDRDDHGRDEDGGDEASDTAMARTNLPGIFLIIIAILNLLGALGAGGIALKNATMTRDEFEMGQKMATSMFPGMQEQTKAMTFEEQKRQGVLIYGLGCAVGLVGFILPLLAGIKMRSLSSYGLCMAGAVVAVIPCVSMASCPCAVGAVVGIWAIVVLASPDVKNAFR